MPITPRERFEHRLRTGCSRRRLLQGVLGSGLAAISLEGRPTRIGGAFQATAGSPPRGPFTLGVASGDPWPDGVVLWTRLAPNPLAEDGRGGMEPAPVAVRWEIAEDEGFGRVVGSGTVTATPELGHSVHVDATGLRPGAEYAYRFMVGNEVSPVGRTKTAPARNAPLERLRFAFVSCAHWEHGYFTAYRHLAGEELDVVLGLGDYLYEYGASNDYTGGKRPVRLHTGGETMTLGDYRVRHALYKTDPDLQAAHRAHPWIVTWDDHEVENNYAGAVSENEDPVEVFLARRAAAYQAYYEHLPLRPESMPSGPDLRLYRRLAFGDLAEFHVLDTRQYRTDQPCNDAVGPRCPGALDPGQTMMGAEQEAWLLDGLSRSTARWQALAQQTMMAQLDVDNRPDRQQFVPDMWDGYPLARSRLLGQIRDAGVANVTVLTGDIHSAWVSDLRADFGDDVSPVVASEFVCTSVTADNPFARLLPFALPFNPHLKFFDARHGYTRCEVTPARWRADFRAVETVSEPAAPAGTVSSWVVEAGRAGVLPA